MNLSNILAVRVYNLMQTVEGVGFWDILKVLDLDMTSNEVYILFLKLMKIKNIIADHDRKEMETRRNEWRSNSG